MRLGVTVEPRFEDDTLNHSQIVGEDAADPAKGTLSGTSTVVDTEIEPFSVSMRRAEVTNRVTMHWLLLASLLSVSRPDSALAAESDSTRQDGSRGAGSTRVEQLLGRMTLAEKLQLIHDAPEDPATYQGQAGYVAGIPRLSIPGLRFADGPPGVLTRQPSQAETATMGVAATFDVRLARWNGMVIGREARALGIDVALQPYINIDRDLSFRRAYNTFGEDPLLTARMGVAEIQGIQSQGVMAMAKHFVGFDGNGTNVWIDDQALHEIYLPPFEAAVQNGVAAVMCAYNHINGPYACGDHSLLTDTLRTQWGFRGFVTSDWGASHSAQFLKAGLDLEMIDGPDSTGFQEPAFFGAEPVAIPHWSTDELVGDIYGSTIPEESGATQDDEPDSGEKVSPETIAAALASGSVTEAEVTRAAADLLGQMDRFGYLDGSRARTPVHRQIEVNARIIERTAEEAAVLLKNEGDLLPLKRRDLKSLVLIGPTAAQVDAIGISGERSLGLISRQVGPLEALRRLSGEPDIQFAVADDMTGQPIPPSALSHGGQPGLLRSGPGGSSVDASLDFTFKGRNALPPNTHARWEGTLTVPRDGTYWLYLQALGTRAGLWIDGKLVGATGSFQGDVHGEILQANQDNVIPSTDGLDNVRRAVTLTAGEHSIAVRISPDTSDAPVQLRLSWYTPEKRAADHAAAIAAARRASVAIVFVWARRLPAFVLPGEQDRLVHEIAAVNPRTIVVLNTSQPVALPWADAVPSIVQMWWPGDEGGWATARLLLGRVSPSGRLPVSWARRLEDYPATDPRFPERTAAGVNHETRYTEGIQVGYRWFDQQQIEPRFAFGSGLSYTSFHYSDLRVRPTSDGGQDVRVRIRNTGPMDGDEVPQVYLGAPRTASEEVQFSVRALVAFDRVHLRAGQTADVTLHVAPRQLQYWSPARHGWVIPPGPRTLSVGASSRDLRLETLLQ